MVINSDLELVKSVLGEDNWDLTNELQCGDQKLFYSYFNRDQTNPLGYAYAGQNGNTVSDYLLNQIAEANSSKAGRTCSNTHYKKVFSKSKRLFYGDSKIQNKIKENFYCSPKGLAIDRIRLGCRITGKYTVDNLESFQFIKYNSQGDKEAGKIHGNKNLLERFYKDISLNGASEVSIEFWGPDITQQSNDSFNPELRITTWDSRGKQIDEVRCGEFFDHNL